MGELGSCAARPAAADGTRQGRCCSCGQYWLGYAGHGWPEALVAASARAVPDELGGKAVQCTPPPSTGGGSVRRVSHELRCMAVRRASRWHGVR